MHSNCFIKIENTSVQIYKEILWFNNNAHIIRKSETLKDLIHNQVLLNF